MFQTMKKRMKNEKGLTLIELLAVIVILAIIAAIAIPAIGNIITNSKYNAIKSDALNVLNAAQLHKMDHDGSESVTVETLKNTGYLESAGIFESVEKTAAVNTTKSPLTLTGTVKFDTYDIKFENADITSINSDKKKGKDIKATYTVGTEK